MNILALSRILTFSSMLGSLAIDPLAGLETSHGFKLLAFSLTPTNSPLGPPKVATWDSDLDHLKFTIDKQYLVILEQTPFTWYSSDKDIKIERLTQKNSVLVTIKDKAVIMVNVVPVTKEDDRIHNYKLPIDDCFAHLEVQFKFINLSTKVYGILGRTNRPDFKNPAKPGVAMPVVGGEDSFRTSALLSHDCKTCLFSEDPTVASDSIKPKSEYALLDCSRGASSGYGIVCRK